MKKCLFCQLLGAQKILSKLIDYSTEDYEIVKVLCDVMSKFVQRKGLNYEIIFIDLSGEKYIQIQKLKGKK